MNPLECQTYRFPTLMRFGPGVIAELGPHLVENKYKSPLLVTDGTCVMLNFFKNIVKQLKSKGLDIEIYQHTHKNPIKADADMGVEIFLQTKRDCIIGVGGGTSLDVAKTIALKANRQNNAFALTIPHFVSVPTTNSTGSDVGRRAALADEITKNDDIFYSPHLIAKIVFADPELTMELPPHLTAASGMDALALHIEAYLADGFHPLCDGIAIEGIKLAWKNLDNATHKPDIQSRSNMMMASLMGAVAFQKGLGVIHSTAQPISTQYNTHHGLAKAIMLPYGLKFNIPYCHKKLQNLSDAIWTHDFIKSISELVQKLELPSKLSEIGIEEQDVAHLATLAFQDPCHAYNPRPVKEKDFEMLYKDAL